MSMLPAALCVELTPNVMNMRLFFHLGKLISSLAIPVFGHKFKENPDNELLY